MKKPAATSKKKAARVPVVAAPGADATTTASQPKTATPAARKAKAAKPAAKKVAAPKEAGTSKKDQVIALIGRKGGATLAEIMEATGWQKHTVRGFVSILGKGGAKIASSRGEAGARTYGVA